MINNSCNFGKEWDVENIFITSNFEQNNGKV